MGGMAYLDGTWYTHTHTHTHTNTHTHTHTNTHRYKAEPPFYNTSTEQPPVVSFSATPCRDGFARCVCVCVCVCVCCKVM